MIGESAPKNGARTIKVIPLAAKATPVPMLRRAIPESGFSTT